MSLGLDIFLKKHRILIDDISKNINIYHAVVPLGLIVKKQELITSVVQQLFHFCTKKRENQSITNCKNYYCLIGPGYLRN